MGPFGYNPKKNPILDALRKDEVLLLAFPAFAYGEKSKARDVVAEFSRRREVLGPRVDLKTLIREAAERLDTAASEVFGTTQRPFIVACGADAYVAFAPELMTEAELSAFQTAVTLHSQKLATIIARRKAAVWTYHLSA